MLFILFDHPDDSKTPTQSYVNFTHRYLPPTVPGSFRLYSGSGYIFEISTRT